MISGMLLNEVVWESGCERQELGGRVVALYVDTYTVYYLYTSSSNKNE